MQPPPPSLWASASSVGSARFSSAKTRPLPANPRECRRFSHTWKSHRRDRTGWLGREDSNPRVDAGKEQLGMDPECVEIVGDALGGDLLVALMVDIMREEQRARPLGDRRRL